MKLLIDTNIILDALMKREPWVKSAEAVLYAVAAEKAEGCITASTFTDLYYLLRKHLRDKEKTKQALLGLIAVVDVLDVTGADCEKAFELPISDYENALLAYCAKRHKVDRIVTRNEKHFVGSPVRTVTPDAIVKRL
jgi:predicted nucleic acid-binding protein